MPGEPRFAPTSEGHVLQLAAHMRAADAEECRAAAGQEPLAALQESVRVSEYVQTLLLGERVAAVFGCARAGPPPATALGDAGVACAWALTSDAVDAAPRAFLAASRVALARMLERYVVLFNMVDARYAAALRWTARLGFTVAPAQPYGPEGRPFHLITLRRSSPWAQQQF